MMEKNRLLGDKLVIGFAYAFIGLFALVCLYPLVLTLSVSFLRTGRCKKRIFDHPSEPQLGYI